jgi:endonuclease G
MKTKKLIILCVCAFTLAACGGDDDPINIHGNSKSSISDDKSENLNKNTTGPTEAQTRYEFPKTKGGTSEVIVHECILNSSSKETGVNYCLEWDHTKRATRWVCYQMYQSTMASNWNRNNWPNGDPWAYDPLVLEDEQQNTYNELSKTTPPLPNSTYYQKGHILPSADRLCSQDANG